MIRRRVLPFWRAALRFLNVLEPGGRLAPRKVALWVALGLAVYSTLTGNSSALMTLISLLTGG